MPVRRIEKKDNDNMLLKLTLVQITAAVLMLLFVFLLIKKDPSAAYRLENEFRELMSEDWDVAGTIRNRISSASAGTDGNIGGEPETGEARDVFASSLTEVSPVVMTDSGSALCSSFYGNDAPVMPVSGPVTSDYGYRIHPIDGGESFHSGRDIAADEGTGIRAALDGTVLAVGVGVSSGNYIKLDHGDGLVTLYCHCSEIYAGEGDIIRKGDIIAAVGQTGAATGPHLHFEVHSNSETEDPAVILDRAADVY